MSQQDEPKRPRSEAPDEAPKDEAPKDEAPKDEAPKDEAPKDEARPTKRRRADVAARRARNKECRLSVVKVGLASLGASKPMRTVIDDVSRRTQRLVYEATLLANCTVAYALERGEPVPDVHEQNFWYQCITQCGIMGEASVPKPSPSPAIAAAFRDVYAPSRGDVPFESATGISMVLTDNALTLVTNTNTMVATTFHDRMRQALGRELDRGRTGTP